MDVILLRKTAWVVPQWISSLLSIVLLRILLGWCIVDIMVLRILLWWCTVDIILLRDTACVVHSGYHPP